MHCRRCATNLGSLSVFNAERSNPRLLGALLGYLALAPFLTPAVFGSVFGMIAGVLVFLALDKLMPEAKRYSKGARSGLRHDHRHGRDGRFSGAVQISPPRTPLAYLASAARIAEAGAAHYAPPHAPCSSPSMTDRTPPAAPRAIATPHLALLDYGLIGLQSMLWGSAFFFVAIVGRDIAPITMTALRLVPACLVLLIVIYALGLRLPASRSAWGKMLLMSAFNNVIPFVLIIYAQRDVSGGLAAIFNATAPLFAVFIAPLFVPEERWSLARIAGIMTGIAGVALLVGGKAGVVSSAAAALLLIAASCYATANVMTRLFFPGYPPFVIACAQMLASLFLAVIAALLLEQPWAMTAPSPKSLLAITAMGILSSAFASLCHFTVLRRTGPTNAMLVTIILPLTPILLGSLLLGEQITLQQVVGGLVIASALVMIDGRLLNRFRRQANRAETS